MTSKKRHASKVSDNLVHLYEDITSDDEETVEKDPKKKKEEVKPILKNGLESKRFQVDKYFKEMLYLKIDEYLVQHKMLEENITFSSTLNPAFTNRIWEEFREFVKIPNKNKKTGYEYKIPSVSTIKMNQSVIKL